MTYATYFLEDTPTGVYLVTRVTWRLIHAWIEYPVDRSIGFYQDTDLSMVEKGLNYFANVGVPDKIKYPDDYQGKGTVLIGLRSEQFIPICEYDHEKYISCIDEHKDYPSPEYQGRNFDCKDWAEWVL